MAGTDSNIPADFEAFRRYQNGEMLPEEQHRLEKLMLEDPMTAEAFEGFLIMSKAEHEQDQVSMELSNALNARMQSNKKNALPMWTYAAAARS